MLSSEYYNLPRWDGHEAPFYEVYYLKVNEPSLGVALWLRYTFLAPRPRLGQAPRHEQPTASLWAIFFDSKAPGKNLALKETIPAKEAIFKKGSFHLNLGGAVLGNEGASGGLTTEGGSIEWDINWRTSENVYKPYPLPLYYLPWPKSKVVIPNLRVGAKGFFSVNGLRFELRNNPLHQGHVWGSGYSGGWAWADCGSFNEDGSAVLDLLANRKAGYGLLSEGGRDIKFRLKGSYSLTGWEFEGKTSKKLVKGRIIAPKEDIVGITYDGPNAEKRFCYNTNVADAVVDVMEKVNGKWLLKTQLTSYGSTAFETVESHPIQSCRLML